MVHAQQIEEQKIKERERGNKRARTSSFNFSQPRSEGGNRPQFHQRSSAPAPSSASAPVPKFRNDNKDRAPGSKSQGSVSKAVLVVPVRTLYVRSVTGTIRVSVERVVMCASGVASKAIGFGSVG